MPTASAALFSSPISGILALALAITALVIGRRRELNLPLISERTLAAGILLLALAAFGPLWNHPQPGSIAVMVDLSPSTRGANFRNPDYVRQRLAELLGKSPYRLFAFASNNLPLDPAGPFTEIPTDQTIFTPPNADAIILFSDARFDPPAKSHPIYPIIDPALEIIADASVRDLRLTNQSLSATIANSGPPRQASFPSSREAIPTGTFIINKPIPAGESFATVRLTPADLWPENDSLSIPIAEPWLTEKWWVGPNPPSGWRALSASQLPDLPLQYLAPSIIVLNNQSADSFPPAVLDRLMQFTRDLGGSILLIGGDHAFAPGNYPGTILEQLSPLSSSPPVPTTRWILLTDASGSMSQDAGHGISRWQAATNAIIHILPTLPPVDPVQIGQFSDSIKWWLPSQTAASVAKSPLPPPDAFPHGPTNLESALNQIADQSDDSIPTQLLLISDCDAQIDHPADLQNQLLQKQIHLNVLAIDHGSALSLIQQISSATAGQFLQQKNPAQWANSIRTLSHSALPTLFSHDPVTIFYEHEDQSFISDMATDWNRTWIKPEAQLWAETSHANQSIPMAAYWPVGTGQVGALAFQPDPQRFAALIQLISQKPRDPRFSVRVENASPLQITITATDNGKFLNDLPIALQLIGSSTNSTTQFQQTAPGQYEATLDSPKTPQIAAIKTKEETIDQLSIPARYPPEFDALGNDHPAMATLAARTDGQVINPTDHTPINFHWPLTTTPLAPWISAIALLLISYGLITWRRM